MSDGPRLAGPRLADLCSAWDGDLDSVPWDHLHQLGERFVALATVGMVLTLLLAAGRTGWSW